MIKNLSWEFENRRRAIGFLKFKTEQKEFQGNKFMMFVIRHVMLKYSKYRIYEYSMSASGQVMRDLLLVEPNQLVNVLFEIKSKQKKENWYTTSMRCLEIFQYGTVAPQWYWDIEDGMTTKEGKEIKDLLATPPDIASYLGNNPSNRGYTVQDYVENTFRQRDPKTIPNNEPEPDLPF